MFDEQLAQQVWLGKGTMHDIASKGWTYMVTFYVTPRKQQKDCMENFLHRSLRRVIVHDLYCKTQ